jgi:two-component system response regulator HydG
MEKKLIVKTLDETGGNKSQAARILGISRQTLREKTKLYDVE